MEAVEWFYGWGETSRNSTVLHDPARRLLCCCWCFAAISCRKSVRVRACVCWVSVCLNDATPYISFIIMIFYLLTCADCSQFQMTNITVSTNKFINGDLSCQCVVMNLINKRKRHCWTFPFFTPPLPPKNARCGLFFKCPLGGIVRLKII